MILPLSRTLKTIPSIQAIRQTGSKGRFCHSWAAWLALFVMMEMADVESSIS